MDRGFFYCFANKKGTLLVSDKPAVAGNYFPDWTGAFAPCQPGASLGTRVSLDPTCCSRALVLTGEQKTYQVLGAWPEKLWKRQKLSSEQYREYLFLTRDGVVSRARNLEAVQAEEKSVAVRQEMLTNVKRLRGNPALFRPFPSLPEVDAW